MADVQKNITEHRTPGQPRNGGSERKFPGKEAGAALLTLAAALTLWLFISSGYRREAVKEISRSLETINSHKAEQIVAWLDEHNRAAVRLGRHPFLCELVSAEISSPGSRRARLTAWLQGHTEEKRYAAMAFLSPKGAVIAATPGYTAGTEKMFTEAFTQAAQKGTPVLTDLYRTRDGRLRMAMFSPISPGGRGGKPLCMMVMKIDPERWFYPLLKAEPLFFATAETLLVRREGENVLFLNELDYLDDTALKFSRPISEKLLPAAAAIRGITGFFAGVDYRGVKVFSAIGPVSGSNWAIITKVDRDTILAPVKNREHMQLALILLAAGLLYGGVYAVLSFRQRAAEAALAKSRLLMAEIGELGKIGAWEFNIDTRRQAWTEQVYRIHETGPDYRPDVDSGINFYAPASRPVIALAVQRAIERGESFDLELEIITAKGNTRAVHAVGKADLKARRVYGLCQDITEHKRAEELILKKKSAPSHI
ncbi:MAG: hypothetical protein Q7R35_00410 [Elusimicrobiota bacterium]|nr:hypothetical protein [Elusimicrobiota bacterium]